MGIGSTFRSKFHFLILDRDQNEIEQKKDPLFWSKIMKKSWKNHEKSWKSRFFFVNLTVWYLFVILVCSNGPLIILNDFYDILLMFTTVFEPKITSFMDFIHVKLLLDLRISGWFSQKKKSTYYSSIGSRPKISMRIDFWHP